MTQRRRKTTSKERLEDCSVPSCRWPISNRHHTLDFAEYEIDDDEYCIQLCSRCHELFHLAYNALIHKGKRAVTIWQGFLCRVSGEEARVKFITDLVRQSWEAKLDYDLTHRDKNRPDSAFTLD